MSGSPAPSEDYMPLRTVVDTGSAQHLIIALDIGVEELDKVKVIRCMLPLDEVFNLVLVSHKAATADDRDGLDDCVDGREEEAEV